MTGSKEPGRKSILRLADLLAEDVMYASDDALVAEYEEAGGDADVEAARCRALFDASLFRANKARLLAARKGVVARRRSPIASLKLDPNDARRRLRSIIERPGVPIRLTMAARNERDLSDADVTSILEDLRDLGILDEDGNS